MTSLKPNQYAGCLMLRSLSDHVNRKEPSVTPSPPEPRTLPLHHRHSLAHTLRDNFQHVVANVTHMPSGLHVFLYQGNCSQVRAHEEGRLT